MLGNCFRPLCALLLVVLVLHKVHIGSALFFRPISTSTDFKASVSSGNNPPSQPIHTVYPKTFSTFHVVNPPVTPEVAFYKPADINYNAQALNRQVSNLLNSNAQVSNTQNQNQPQQKFEPPLTFFQTSSLVRTIPIIPERSRSNNTLSRNLKNINTRFPSSVGGAKPKTQNQPNGPTKAISNTANTRPTNSNTPKSTKNPKKTKSVNPVPRARSPRVKSSKANPNLASNRKILKNTNRGRTTQNLRSNSRPSKQPVTFQRQTDEDEEEADNDQDYDPGNDADNEDPPQDDEPEGDDGANDEGENDGNDEGENDGNDEGENDGDENPQEEEPQEDDPQEEDPQEDAPQDDYPEEDEDNSAKLRQASLPISDAERIQSAIQVLLRTANNLQRQQSTGSKRANRAKSQRQ